MKLEKPGRGTPPLYERIREILESAQTTATRSVNTAQVIANWLIGRESVEEEQKGRVRAEYGKQLVEELTASLQEDFGKGYSALKPLILPAILRELSRTCARRDFIRTA